MATHPKPDNDHTPYLDKATSDVVVRRLSADEISQANVSDADVDIVARQDSTEEFLAFLDGLPAADVPTASVDADSR